MSQEGKKQALILQGGPALLLHWDWKTYCAF